MAHISNMKRWAFLLACLSLGIWAGPVGLVAGAGATGPPSTAPFPASSIEFVGYGDGPGLGMGQWGAFGYAVLDHEPYSWILAHYYGGTTLSSKDSQIVHDPMVSVDINENDGHPVVVTSTSPFSFGGHDFSAGQAARAVLSAGVWALYEAPSCTATTWTPVASGLVNPIAEPVSLAPGATLDQVLTICEHGGTDLAVRGTVEAYAGPKGAVTLSVLPVEEYVRSVISGEVSWSWGLFGNGDGAPQGEPWGFQALEAQAVATRSYVAAELDAGGWEPYATTCDSYCQSYPGMAGETSDLDAAVADTTGLVLSQSPSAQQAKDAPRPEPRSVSSRYVIPAPGQPAAPPGKTPPGPPPTASGGSVPVLAEYSASSGGYTSGGPFPGVVDNGDGICLKSHFYACNPCHKWHANVPVSAVEKAFKSIGTLAAIEVTERNGFGALGGRVEKLEIVGTSGATVSVGPGALEALVAAGNPAHCASDWYGVSNGP